MSKYPHRHVSVKSDKQHHSMNYTLAEGMNFMRKIAWMLAVLLSVALFAAGCGSKNAEGVVKDLDKKLSSMESYKGIGTMQLHSRSEERRAGKGGRSRR